MSLAVAFLPPVEVTCAPSLPSIPFLVVLVLRDGMPQDGEGTAGSIL